VGHGIGVVRLWLVLEERQKLSGAAACSESFANKRDIARLDRRNQGQREFPRKGLS